MERVRTTTLADESTTISSEVEDLLLANLPNSLVNGFDVVRYVRNVLNRSIVSNNHVVHVVVPQTEIDKIAKKPWVRVHDGCRYCCKSIRMRQKA